MSKSYKSPCYTCRRACGDIFEGVFCRSQNFDVPGIKRVFKDGKFVSCSHQLVHLCETCTRTTCENRTAKVPIGVKYVESEHEYKEYGRKVIIKECKNYTTTPRTLPVDPYDSRCRHESVSIHQRRSNFGGKDN